MGSDSSTSGVAVLSCTDCSGSSTASSDITDPGSPFSTASSHSEDSGSQPAKMPPTQTAHHPPWPWTAEEGPPIKRSLQEKTAFPKRLKSNEDTSKQSPPCLNAPKVSNSDLSSETLGYTPNPNNKLKCVKLSMKFNQMQQNKITEYFKSQVKVHVINKKNLPNLAMKSKDAKNCNNKFVSLVDQQTQFNGIRPSTVRTVPQSNKKVTDAKSNRKSSQVTVPRKILPAPSKIPENVTINNHVNNMTNFTPTVTLTAVSFPPNLTYLHTKSPKPPDANIFVPQFTALAGDKINGIPLLNRTPCLNVIQPVQKITTINNFNCVKLNATVVPIVKLNTLPSRLNGSSNNLANVALSVETAAPTVLTAKPKTNLTAASLSNLTPKQHATTNSPIVDINNVQSKCCRAEESFRTEDKRRNGELHRTEEKSSSPDSDSGISYKDNLEVRVSDLVTVEQQKSPILSQPKTIRFPAKQELKEEIKDAKPTHSTESGLCRWAECDAQFDTSGALLEHLQVKHVISQATQEQYVCLWLGCKVHGRTSCSRSWLERHVLAHAGTKPFRCIVDGCGQRFNSQLALERHVNGHFNADGSQNGSTKKSTESSSSKLYKRNGKKIRFRRQPWSARMFDFFDPGIMEGLQHKLLTMTQNRTLGQMGNAGDTVNVVSQIIARRVEPDGKMKYLVKWHPADIIPDEWVTEKEYVETKLVPIPSLKPAAKDALKSSLFPQICEEGRRQKHRRKPISKQTVQTAGDGSR